MPEAKVPLRRARERDLVAATRALFDERGFRDAPIEEIARTAGIARGLIYRQFASKEELFVLTVTDYLADLDEAIAEAVVGEDDPVEALERIAHAYADFCQRYPAFLDSSLALMRRPARELRVAIPEWIWLRLGRAMASYIGRLAAILRAGSERGVFGLADPDYTANVLWTQTLGAMHLARIGVGMREAGGAPELFRVTAEEVVSSCVSSALATVGAPRAGERPGARGESAPPA